VTTFPSKASGEKGPPQFREKKATPRPDSRWLSALSGTYVWTEVPPYTPAWENGSAGGPRVPGRHRACRYLQRLSDPDALPGAHFWGRYLRRWWRVRSQNDGGVQARAVYHCASHGGAEVDLVLELDGALLADRGEVHDPADEGDKGLRALRATYPDARFRPNIVVAPVSQPFRLSKETLVIPWDLC